MPGMVVGEIAGVAGAYLLGTFPTAQLVGRRVGHDPLREGSGNPGATNVYRTAGRAAGTAVLVGDAAKGALPTVLAFVIAGRWVATLCWLAAVLGHVAPVVRGLHGSRGGKGVATAAGGAIVLYPLEALAMFVVFVGVTKRTRVASLGSLAMALLLPVLVAVTGHPARESIGAAIVSMVVVARHHRNIRRLLAGTEHRIPGG